MEGRAFGCVCGKVSTHLGNVMSHSPIFDMSPPPSSVSVCLCLNSVRSRSLCVLPLLTL